MIIKVKVIIVIAFHNFKKKKMKQWESGRIPECTYRQWNP